MGEVHGVLVMDAEDSAVLEAKADLAQRSDVDERRSPAQADQRLAAATLEIINVGKVKDPLLGARYVNQYSLNFHDRVVPRDTW